MPCFGSKTNFSSKLLFFFIFINDTVNNREQGRGVHNEIPLPVLTSNFRDMRINIINFFKQMHRYLLIHAYDQFRLHIVDIYHISLGTQTVEKEHERIFSNVCFRLEKCTFK